ncbi:hypothetical protein H8959_018963, partial [Pygathrix nigripes]
MFGIRFEDESRRGYQLEPDLSEEVLARLHLGSGSNGLFSRKVSIETKEKNCSGKERDRRMDDLLELTEDMEKEISNALGHGPQVEILSCAFKLQITRGDIQTLKSYHWLNDEVINFYMNLLVERNRKQGYPALHVFSTFFYPKLKSGGYQAVKRWIKGVNLFEQEIILVPNHRKGKTYHIYSAPDASLPEGDGVGNPSSAVAVRKLCLVPLAAGGSFTDISIYLMHCGLKSPCITSVLSQ